MVLEASQAKTRMIASDQQQSILQGNLPRETYVTLLDHVVGDRILMPGVGYLELAFTAQALRGQTLGLENVFFVVPLLLRGFATEYDQ